jgi:SAM-dependent methyltransferase
MATLADSRRAARPNREARAALARLYDLDLADDPGDVELYLALADRAGGRVLELAVGSGRVAVPLAAAGHQVTGVDNDPSMLDRARARGAASLAGSGGSLKLIEADLVGLALPDGAKFEFGYLALNSLMTLGTRAAQQAAIQALADHLEPGGIAAVDVWLPDAEDLARYDGRLILEWARTEPTTGDLVTKTGSAQHDAATGTVALTSVFEEGSQGAPPARWVRTDRLRLVSAEELTGFAEAAGLRVETLAGGYDLDPFGPGSDRAVLVAIRT